MLKLQLSLALTAFISLGVIKSHGFGLSAVGTASMLAAKRPQ